MSKTHKVWKFVPWGLVSLEYPGSMHQPSYGKEKTLISAAVMASLGETKELISGEGLFY